MSECWILQLIFFQKFSRAISVQVYDISKNGRHHNDPALWCTWNRNSNFTSLTIDHFMKQTSRLSLTAWSRDLSVYIMILEYDGIMAGWYASYRSLRQSIAKVHKLSPNLSRKTDLNWKNILNSISFLSKRRKRYAKMRALSISHALWKDRIMDLYVTALATS